MHNTSVEQDVTTDPPGPAEDDRLLRPGRNCWRIERASRVRFLVDGEEYFGAVRSALRKAQQSIFILGWDIDSRMRLVPPGANDGYPEPLCDFLNAIVAERRGLRAYVLSWDYAILYALEREWLPVYKFDWQTHRRLSFRLDDCHPVGGSHHQKVVVVDDSVAFVAGFDLTRCRWDTQDHRSRDPLRVDSSGKPYGPFHDVGVAVEGDCARALSDLARERWQRATRRAPRRRRARHPSDVWPDGLAPDLTDVDIAISRTEPGTAQRAPVQEIRALHLDVIGRARKNLYAENQYFTSRTVSAALAERIRSGDCPDIAIVSPRMQSGWLESSTMGVLRARIHRDLCAMDPAGRYRLYCPVLPWLGEEDGCLNVHSKVLIADDEIVSVGSANLSDRSMNLDTECNVTIEASGSPRVRAAIAAFRDRLLAEHLGVEPAEVEATLQREQRLHRTIEALNRQDRAHLTPIAPELDPMIDAVTPDHDVLDPEVPLDPDLIVADVMPAAEHRSGARVRLAALLVVVLAIAGLALAWRYTHLGEWLDFDALVAYASWIHGQPLAPLIAVAAFVAGAFLVIPVTVLIGVTAVVFGPTLGVLYSLVGAVASSSVLYAMGQRLGRDAVRRFAGRRLNALSRRLARRGVLSIVMIRIVPVAPFSLINLVAGTSHIGWRDFLLGTTVGLLPGIVLTSMFVDRAVAAMRSPSPATFALLALVAGVIAGVAWFVRRRLERVELRRRGNVSLREAT